MDNYVEMYSDGESLGRWLEDVANTSLAWINAHVGSNARLILGTQEADTYETSLVLNASSIKALNARLQRDPLLFPSDATYGFTKALVAHATSNASWHTSYPVWTFEVYLVSDAAQKIA